MADRASSRSRPGASIDEAAARVAAQSARIAAMRFDDPCLRDAFDLLRQLQQDLARAEMDHVFVLVGTGRTSESKQRAPVS